MPIKVQCACGRSMLVKDELAGKLARCPDCKRPVRVPGGRAVEPEYLDEDEDDRPARRPRRGDDRYDDDEDERRPRRGSRSDFDFDDYDDRRRYRDERGARSYRGPSPQQAV